MLLSRFKYDGVPSWNMNVIQRTYREKLLEKIHSGQYTLTDVRQCNCCGSEELEVICEKDRFGLPFKMLICRKCGLLFTSPILSQDSISDFYDNEYHALHFGKESVEQNPHLTKSDQGVKIFEFVKNWIFLSGRKHLRIGEIGCSSGHILNDIKECCSKYGIEVKLYGCEYSHQYVEYANKRYGINVFCGGGDTFLRNNIKVDILILSHVFEHFINLREEKKIMAEIIDNNGIVYIEVPGILDLKNKFEYDCDLLKYFTFAHIYHFSLTTLRNSLNPEFDLLEGDEYVRSIFVKNICNNGHSSHFMNDYKHIIHSLHDLEAFRTQYLANNPKRSLHYRLLRKIKRLGKILIMPFVR